MADTAAHLVDRVLPEVPIRQWVLSLPIPLRYRVAYDRELCSEVLGVFLRNVFSSLRRPQVGLSRDMRRMSTRIPASSFGRPHGFRDFQRQ